MTKQIKVGQTYTLTNGNQIVIEEIAKGDRYNIGGAFYRITKSDDARDVGRTGQSTENSLYWAIDWEFAA